MTNPCGNHRKQFLFILTEINKKEFVRNKIFIRIEDLETIYQNYVADMTSDFILRDYVAHLSQSRYISAVCFSLFVARTLIMFTARLNINRRTVNILISALGAYCFTAVREGALIREGRLLNFVADWNKISSMRRKYCYF